MEYYKNLLENDFTQKKGFRIVSVFNFVFGILMLAFAVYYFIEALASKAFLDYLISIIFLLNGIISILRSFNFYVEKLFGKAFVQINDKGITLKMNPFKAEQTVGWKDVENISYTAGKFFILKKDKTKVNLSVIELSYTTIQEIKKTVSHYTQLKDITLE